MEQESETEKQSETERSESERQNETKRDSSSDDRTIARVQVLVIMKHTSCVTAGGTGAVKFA